MPKNYIINIPSCIRFNSELKEKMNKARDMIKQQGVTTSIPQYFEMALNRFSDEVIAGLIKFGVSIK